MRHILHVKVHEANIHDTVGGCRIFKEALEKYPSLKGVWADAGYRKTMENFVQKILRKTIDISKCVVPGWAVMVELVYINGIFKTSQGTFF